MLFIFNKHGEILVSLVICIHATLGMWGVSITVYWDVVLVGLCLCFVYTEHNKRHEVGIEIRFLTGTLGDILEDSIFSGYQIVKIVC